MVTAQRGCADNGNHNDDKWILGQAQNDREYDTRGHPSCDGIPDQVRNDRQRPSLRAASIASVTRNPADRDIGRRVRLAVIASEAKQSRKEAVFWIASG
jgi:hypothetical protein